MFNLLCLIGITYGYFIQSIFWFIFAKLKHKIVSFGFSSFFINLVSLLLIIMQQVKIGYKYRLYWEENFKIWSWKTLDYLQDDQIIRIYTTSGLIWGFQFIRIFDKLKVSEYFGPFIQIFIMMIINLCKLWIISILLFLCFASSGRIMFNDMDAFQSWSATLKLLYSATFSSFSFIDYENSITTVTVAGMIFIILYTLLMSLIIQYSTLSSPLPKWPKLS